MDTVVAVLLRWLLLFLWLCAGRRGPGFRPLKELRQVVANDMRALVSININPAPPLAKLAKLKACGWRLAPVGFGGQGSPEGQNPLGCLAVPVTTIAAALITEHLGS